MSNPPCILGGCAHAHVKTERCSALGECGAGYALRKASEPGGYEMINFDNPTLNCLRKAKLVEEVNFSGRCVSVKAIRGRAVA